VVIEAAEPLHKAGNPERIPKMTYKNFDACYPDGEKSQILSRLTV